MAEDAPRPRGARRRLAEVAARRRTPASWLSGLWRQWPLLTVLLVVAVGLVSALVIGFVVAGLAIGAAMGLAALLRAVLPDSRIGLLRVRARWIDVSVLGLASAALIVSTLIVPIPST